MHISTIWSFGLTSSAKPKKRIRDEFQKLVDFQKLAEFQKVGIPKSLIPQVRIMRRPSLKCHVNKKQNSKKD